MFDFRFRPAFGLAGAACLAIGAFAAPSDALDKLEFRIVGGETELRGALRDASLVSAAKREGRTAPEDILSAARAEYGRIVNTLYALGYYAPVVHVLVDGREAATIPPLDTPTRIDRVEVTIDTGPAFKFSEATVAPIPRDTHLPDQFAPGKRARSDLIKEAVQDGVDGWRDIGHAKADVAAQDIIADHRSNQLAARIALDPGPRLRFGTLTVEGQDRMRPERIIEIAGLPEGDIYDPEDLRRSADRLRRSGVFRSVTLAEAETITPPDLLDINATVVEELPRRYSLGAEVASFEGLDLTGYWLHRNLLGGGERLKVEGEITNIGAQNSGTDYSLGVTLERPATFTPDTTLGFSTEVVHLDEADYTSDGFSLGTNITQYMSDRLTLSVGLEYAYADVQDGSGSYNYRHLALPLGATWDNRDNKLDARKGTYLDAELRPFLGFGTTDSGLRVKADGRGYVTYGETRPVTLAARGQLGAVFGSSLLGTPRDYLFYSGGGGTVRGQPYQSLGIPVSKGLYSEQIGGMAFAALSTELRARVTPKIGIVAFADAGYVSAIDFGDETGDWHAGAGLGLRYDTGFGPIRFDVATPVAGDTGDGVQIYIGIGQAF
nr:autotransporter assembly complex family protein [Gemmobacter aquatilis]